MAKVFLGLGSNLGDRHANIRRAVDELKKRGINVQRLSTLIESDPAGGPPQTKFINAAAEIKTAISPDELLTLVKSIELHMGRVPTVTNGPRVIDIDILLYDNITLDTPRLTIPHPRMCERDFVMRPLREIAPELGERCNA